ncbi:DUF6176 family protein [Luteibacter yeojuensis]|uniref:Uncharacterized protein n=1 Tax=Luteibacter yeojuensis TaxID=345309 RepID=A0A0F3KU56_9GAMM|nr:DUF6176 family protein [Luteibacter yeojuensis]KJV34800.1 hypothetical protein VI08_09450 [Luteibacter yeojuensis]
MTRHSLLVLTIGLFTGLLTGVGGVMLFLQVRTTPPPHLVVRLHRFALRPDQLDGYAQWQAFLHARHDDAVGTLEREHMYVEAMFRESHEPFTLYWLEVRDDQGATVETSDSGLDIKHREYMHRVLLPDNHVVMTTENVLVAPFIDHAIATHRSDTHASL